ncbi:hypothetical protein [Paeniglutamicibacter psychrophenolicus]|nr:hypothetical protein [Paeniglutamicibacter psychrophenolicus]MDQ0096287.1 hypothetical protein [Paeniglutamicibacter psychrophenolicus]
MFYDTKTTNGSAGEAVFSVIPTGMNNEFTGTGGSPQCVCIVQAHD